MEKDFELKGITEIVQNINKALEDIENKSTAGMIEGCIIVRRDMEKTPPRIPIDKGNLRASFFIVSSRTSGDKAPGKKPDGEVGAEHPVIVGIAQSLLQVEKNPVVAMGFTANYAIYVHENLEADFERPIKIGGKLKKRRPGAGPKFFEASLKRNQQEIINAIKNAVQL